MKIRSRRTTQSVRRVYSLIARLGSQISENDEKRVVEAFTTHCPEEKLIPWIRSVRRSSRNEDHWKIDIVFETDVGPIYVQVKGSHWGLDKFASQQFRGTASLDIIGVIINPSMDHLEIFQRVLRPLSHERQRRLRKAA